MHLPLPAWWGRGPGLGQSTAGLRWQDPSPVTDKGERNQQVSSLWLFWLASFFFLKLKPSLFSK